MPDSTPARPDASEDLSVNPSCNPGFDDVLAIVAARRRFLKGGAGAAALAFLGTAPLRPGAVHAAGSGPTLGFAAVSQLGNDMVVVPPGYRVQVLYAWGDPIGKAACRPASPLGLAMRANRPPSRNCRPVRTMTACITSGCPAAAAALPTRADCWR